MTDLPITTAALPVPRRLSGIDRALAAALDGFVAALGIVAALAPRGMISWMIGALALTGLSLALPSANRHPITGSRPTVVPSLTTLALVALAAASVAWSPSPRAALTALEIAAVALSGWVLGSWVATRDETAATRLGSLFLIGLAGGTAVFAAEYSLGFPMNRLINGLMHGSPPGFVALSNNTPKRAMALLTALLWPAALIVRRRFGGRAAALLIIGAAVAILAQPSRSAAVGLLLGVVCWLCALWSPVAVRRGLAGLLIIASLGAIPAALALRDAGADRSPLLFRSAQHRVEIWARAAGRSLQAPWLGHGIDASRALRPAGETSRFEKLDNTLLPLHPHNAFLQIWLELGAAGMALTTALGLSAIAATRRLAADCQPYALAFLTSALSMASTAYGLWQAWWMAGLLTAGLLMTLATRVPVTGRQQPGTD